MAELYPAKCISEGWLLCMEHLINVGGSDENLIVAIASGRETDSLRNELDEFYCTHRSTSRLASVERVANTIFPVDLYVGQPGERARQRLYDMQRKAARIEHRFTGDCYFDRLIDWPCVLDGQDKTWNQLDYCVKSLRTMWNAGNRTINIAELGVSSGLPEADDQLPAGCDLRTQHPSKDRSIMGFPCLSHISVTVSKGSLHLTAVYRNQHFMAKAYGNFVGLSRLQEFICKEVGCPRGNLVCIATHADAELGKNGVTKKEILTLVGECRDLLDNARALEIRS